MRMKMKAHNVGSVVADLTNIAKRSMNHAARTMRSSADNIAENAALFAPRDEWRLEESIQVDADRWSGRHRLMLSVSVGGIIEGVNVSQYAWMMHENYDDFNPGPGTIEKREENPGVDIGGKFLERAVDLERDRLHGKMIEGLVRIVG